MERIQNDKPTTSWLFHCPVLSTFSILYAHPHTCSSESETIITGVSCNTTNSVSVDHHLSILRVQECWTCDNCVETKSLLTHTNIISHLLSHTFTSNCCSTPLAVTLTCSLTSVTRCIPRITTVSGHIGVWVVCDIAISREGQHGAGSWVGKLTTLYQNA